MKRKYEKPMISVENMSIDMPIAANCVADFDDVNSLVELGYFGTNDRGITCSITYDDYVDNDLWGHDTVCYHSNVQTAFLS